MEYSRSPQEFQDRFKKTIEKEQQMLWESEFSLLKSGQYFQFDEIEDIILDSNLHRESFQQHRAQYQAFENMIPKLNLDSLKVNESRLIEDSISLVDYLYCSHGYYSWYDRALAKVRAFLKRYI